MIYTLLWKEYREQRSVWLALPAFTGLMLVGIWWLLEQSGPPRALLARRDALMALAVILAGTYGIVCGAMLLANEREAGTLVFLDALTGRRAPLWWSKLLAGVVLTLAHSLLLVAVVALLLGSNLGDNPLLLILWLTLVTWVGLSALASGLLMSAVFSNVLVASASAVLLFGFATVLTALLSILMEYLFRGSVGLMVFGCECAWTVAALAGSRRLFCGSDRLRGQPPVEGRGRGAEAWHGWQSILWLVYRQGKVIVLVLALAALGLTFLFSLGKVVVWPVVSGLIGVACGLCTFAPEQAAGTGRFLGALRLPPGRVWTGKVACWFGVACSIGVGTLLVAGLVDWGGSNYWSPGAFSLVDACGAFALLALWLTHGFATGQLLTLLVRKTAIAALFAGMLASGLVLLWLPSLIVGGLQSWQWLGVPALLLLAGRTVVWPWWNGAFRDWRGLLPLAGCGLLTAGWLGLHLGQRAIEVPDVGAPFDVAAFEASLPTPEQNQTGLRIRRAILDGDRAELRQAAHMPPGMLSDPRTVDLQLARLLLELRQAATGLRADADQQLAHGDSAAALDTIVDLLALSRQVRRHAPTQVYAAGQAIEDQALEALEAWQLQVADQPKLLARARSELAKHEAQLPPPADLVKANYVAYRHGLDDLNGVTSLPEIAFLAPWERTRLERTGNALFGGWLRAAESEPWKCLPGASVPVGLRTWAPATEGAEAAITEERLGEVWNRSPVLAGFLARYAPWPGAARALRKLRIAQVRLAMTQCAVEDPVAGAAPTLKDLVPRYLPGPLVDPLTGTPIQPEQFQARPAPRPVP